MHSKGECRHGMKTDYQISLDEKEFTYNESLSEAVFAGVLYTIGYAALVAAVFNLIAVRPLPVSGLAGSILWIAFIGATIIPNCRKRGVRQHFVHVLGNFVRNRFAVISEQEGVQTITFGYRFHGNRHRILQVRTDGITEVDWGPAQGNDPKRDNCWNVAMRFNKDAVLFDGDKDGHPLCIVGKSNRRKSREDFGAAFIAFLIRNHVQLKIPSNTLIGQVGEVTESVWPHGRLKIKIGTAEYLARPLGRIRNVGTRVKVTGIRGSTIYVMPEND